jgi:hypothetical protein
MNLSEQARRRQMCEPDDFGTHVEVACATTKDIRLDFWAAFFVTCFDIETFKKFILSFTFFLQKKGTNLLFLI